MGVGNLGRDRSGNALTRLKETSGIGTVATSVMGPAGRVHCRTPEVMGRQHHQLPPRASSRSTKGSL